MPIKCPICREAFLEPVVTRCSHYFCERCALAQYRVNPACSVCQAQTGGFFKPAKEIVAKLKQQEQLKKQMGISSTTTEQDKSSDDDDDDNDNNP